MSLSFLVDAVSILGGGSTTAGWGIRISRLEIAELISGAGATTDSDMDGAATILLLTAGGGAITEVGSVGSFISEARMVATGGMVGCMWFQATTFGSATSLLSFTWGGVTMVCR